MTRAIVVFLGVAAAVGVLSQWPGFHPLPPGHGELTLSMAHLTARLEPCRSLTEEERAALPPNMRVLEVCARPRVPAVIEVTVNDERLLAAAVRPAGLHRDGRAYLVRSWALPAGIHRVTLNLRDTPREEGFDERYDLVVDLAENASIVMEVGDGGVRMLNAPIYITDPE